MTKKLRHLGGSVKMPKRKGSFTSKRKEKNIVVPGFEPKTRVRVLAVRSKTKKQVGCNEFVGYLYSCVLWLYVMTCHVSY